MEIAKTPYKSIYMTVPKTKFSKFSESIYMPIHISLSEFRSERKYEISDYRN